MTLILIGRFRTCVLGPKTMAAGVIANAKQLDPHKIDGSSVASKCVGEKEKNLSQIFLKVEPSNLMLFLDEANVLSGKRSTVEDVRDRYSNSEKGPVLQNLREIQRALVNLPRCDI